MTQNLPINQYLLLKNKQNIFYFEEISICQDRKNELLIMNLIAGIDQASKFQMFLKINWLSKK